MLELVDIHKRFGLVQALRGVTLQAAPGTIHGIVGENGAGKSTLMKILTGFIARTSGEIVLDGKPITLASPNDARKQGIGMLYQEPLDFPQLSVLDNFLAGHHSYNRRRGATVLAELSREFGFTLHPEKCVEELTVGERQQLELLRIIRDGVTILILDEPTTGISEAQQEQLFSALRKLRKDGATIFLVSHKLEEVDMLCDAVSVLRNGSLVAGQQAPFVRQELLTAMFGELPEAEPRPHTPMARDSNPLLELTDVTINSGRSGLHHADLRIRRGEIVGLAGVDGSGQFVFLKACCGLLPIDSGTIHRSGQPDTGQPGAGFQRQTVFLPADRLSEGLFPSLSIREHHLLADQKGGFFISGSSYLGETKRAIATFNIKGNDRSQAAELSGGNQQRLLLSLIPESTELILLENPTRGLDIHSAAWTWKFLHQRIDTGATIIFASPDLEEIMREADRVVVFFNGRIALDRPTGETDYAAVSKAITGDLADERSGS